MAATINDVNVLIGHSESILNGGYPQVVSHYADNRRYYYKYYWVGRMWAGWLAYRTFFAEKLNGKL